MTLTRRSLFAGGGLAAMAVAAGPVLTRPSAYAAPAGAEPIRYGPASLTAAVRGAVVSGDSVFISSRFNTSEQKLRLGEFDVRTGEQRSVRDLDISSSGGHKLASDGQYVYIGPAGNTHVWRLDPATGDLHAWAEAGTADTWYYEMVVNQEYLYIGTYPDCTVKRIRLSDGSTQTYGRISDSKYAAALAVDDTHVYAGSAAPGTLLAWPKDGGEPLDLTDQLSDSPVGVLDLAVADGMLYVASGRQLVSFAVDGSDRVSREIPEEDRYLDQVTVADDGAVYAIARLTTNTYQVTADGLTSVGRPLTETENQLLAALPDGHLLGVSGLGHIWSMPPGGTAEVWESANSDFGYPELVQSMLRHSEGTIWVAGHYAMTVHRPEQGDSARFYIGGEPKSLAEDAQGVVYAGLYPSARIVAIDPKSHRISDVGLVDNEQLRLRRIQLDSARNQLVVASSPATTKHTGALTFVDLDSHQLDVRRDYLPEQSVMDVALVGDTAYIVGDTHGEGTSGPLRPTAQVAAVDLNTRELRWRAELRPDWESYESVFVADGVLYAVGRRPRGAWFAYDLATETVVANGDLGGYGQLNGADDRVFAWVHWANDIVQLPTQADDDVRVVHPDVPRGWYNDPIFSFTKNGKSTWGMYGTDLALFRLTSSG